MKKVNFIKGIIFVILLIVVAVCSFILGVEVESSDHEVNNFATANAQKASEIQQFLLKKHITTTLQGSIFTLPKYSIGITGKFKQDVMDKVQVELAQTDILTPDVYLEIYTDSPSYFPEYGKKHADISDEEWSEYLKNLGNEFERKISLISGVDYVNCLIKENKPDRIGEYHGYYYTPTIIINIKFKKGNDVELLKRTVKNLMFCSLHDLEEQNLDIRIDLVE